MGKYFDEMVRFQGHAVSSWQRAWLLGKGEPSFGALAGGTTPDSSAERLLREVVLLREALPHDSYQFAVLIPRKRALKLLLPEQYFCGLHHFRRRLSMQCQVTTKYRQVRRFVARGP